MTPYKIASGGIELAHQLVDYLLRKGKNAYIVYNKESREIVKSNQSVMEQYKKYNIAISGNIEDNEENVLILPEIYLFLIPKYKKIQVCVWWMSVDFALERNANFLDNFRHAYTFYDKWQMLLHPIHYGRNRFSMNRVKKEDYRLFHFYQATYIQQYLYSKGLTKLVKLSDYINQEILNNVSTSKAKENIILYNPVKGIRYSKKLMKVMNGYKFIALKGFTRQQLNDLFDRAKLYIDFGPFPGKDRLPREAVVHNCCIITGQFGASRYFEDVPIPSHYKFDMLHVDYNMIKACVDNIFDKYDECTKDFDYMREVVKCEQGVFYREIDNIFL